MNTFIGIVGPEIFGNIAHQMDTIMRGLRPAP